MSVNSNSNQDYSVLGGWLLVWYWCLIVGGVLTLLSMALPALISIASSFLVGIIYAVGRLVSIASACISAVLNIKAASQLKERSSQFFDTFVLGTLVSVGGGIIASFLSIRRISGIGSFISSTIGSLVAAAIGLCLCIMYFSKSVRVNTYFSGRPLQSSQYWNWIKILPDFIISDAMPDPSQIQQLGSRSQQADQQSQSPQDTQSSSDAQSPGDPE